VNNVFWMGSPGRYPPEFGDPWYLSYPGVPTNSVPTGPFLVVGHIACASAGGCAMSNTPGWNHLEWKTRYHGLDSQEYSSSNSVYRRLPNFLGSPLAARCLVKPRSYLAIGLCTERQFALLTRSSKPCRAAPGQFVSPDPNVPVADHCFWYDLPLPYRLPRHTHVFRTWVCLALLTRVGSRPPILEFSEPWRSLNCLRTSLQACRSLSDPDGSVDCRYGESLEARLKRTVRGARDLCLVELWGVLVRKHLGQEVS